MFSLQGQASVGFVQPRRPPGVLHGCRLVSVMIRLQGQCLLHGRGLGRPGGDSPSRWGERGCGGGWVVAPGRSKWNTKPKQTYFPHKGSDDCPSPQELGSSLSSVGVRIVRLWTSLWNLLRVCLPHQ